VTLYVAAGVTHGEQAGKLTARLGAGVGGVDVEELSGQSADPSSPPAPSTLTPAALATSSTLSSARIPALLTFCSVSLCRRHSGQRECCGGRSRRAPQLHVKSDTRISAPPRA
jgi:hypothetical protein